ncbi:endolytic transglycosylase MltG, partial [Patescibacteria group bacterium]|nr:endolytic transglycosylase MltG [Patescibacteria group bacterium]MBU1703016.1 endolytic transglycosylase MltG [Patescibacteria group bacterium]MBU1954048.1 endolytic transglycosylase MltG [Patescibacteria group bacterium]
MKKRYNKAIKPLRYILIGLGILAVFGLYQYSRYQFYISTPVESGNTSNISFVINKGENLSDIANNLLEKDLILDRDAFKWYAKLGGFDRSVVAGRFLLNKNLTIPEIVDIITNTKKSELVLTVPEGSITRDIDKKLTDLGVIASGDFINAVNTFDNYDKYFFLDREAMKTLPHPLEGYLFPDTYFIDPLNFYSENL